MNFWEEPHPWILIACASIAVINGIIVYPHPIWALPAVIASVSVSAVIAMRIIHWWDFEE